MAKNKINMPTSSAGITRYFDDYKSKIEFKPGHIVFLAIFVMLFVIALNIWGASLFGF
ncbi:preprotein translocase subunit Sec61beta [archaeon]|jgi:preprotein translocase subunit Sec61beta|nr:preprotein translocase subunit Sec61beta [archaeon]MBT3721630.1 preprotein translocase subunit Sec61beta [archaeon]MBT4022920.1 preprotein translocase subunit Sec61beta [archaeon]MBT4271911.1 preprotein translocase subunit Sec61beta [archaeon]MBT4461749.1 preprotein translocase subunit Sec61beta [archaeon]